MLACGGRGELGRLLFWGRGGGSICVEVRLEADCEGAGTVTEGGPGAVGGLGAPRGDFGTVFRSGILTWRCQVARPKL